MKLTKIHIVGAGSQGKAWMANLGDQRIPTVVYVREPRRVKKASLWRSVQVRPLHRLSQDLRTQRGRPLVALLTPDETHGEVIRRFFPRELPLDLVFAHGYTPTYEKLSPDIEPLLCAPKLVGVRLRQRFVRGQAVPISVFGRSARSLKIARALGRLLGASPRTLIEVSWQQETEADLFSEQALLCGGIAMLVESAYTTLLKAGVPPEAAWAETLFELNMLVDLYAQKGFKEVFKGISGKAAIGSVFFGRKYRKQIEKQHQALWNSIHSRAFHQRSKRILPRQVRKVVARFLSDRYWGTRNIDRFYAKRKKWIEEIMSE